MLSTTRPLQARPPARFARIAAALVCATLAAAAGVGLLYLLRSASLLGVGPHLRGALPLQQLAGDDAQPLLRMAVAWLPAGAAAGLAARRIGRLARTGLVTVAVTATLLALSGAVSDAIASAFPLTPHLLPQLRLPGFWAAVGLAGGGALLVAWAEAGTRPRGRLLGAALALVTAAGLVGVVSYARDYDRYRGFPPPHHPAGVQPGKLVDARFHSAAFGRVRSYKIVLPPGYVAAAARGQRFPVLYLLHGTSGSPRLLLETGATQVAFDTLLARNALRPFLIVMPDGRDGTRLSDTEWANTAHGPYEDLVLETVREVDRRWSTVPDRRARAIAGLSEGAYGAVNISLHHLNVFSIVQSWSGYFHQTATKPFKNASLALVRANAPEEYVHFLGARLRRYPLAALLYSGGRHDPASRSLAKFAPRLRAAGARVRTIVYPGGHDWRLWRRHVPEMLRYASGELWRGR